MCRPKEACLAGALRGALSLPSSSNVTPLFNEMRAADLTLDVQPSDREAALLLGAIFMAEMTERTSLGGLVALGILTASFGGVRQSATTPQLVADADKCLASMQMSNSGRPKDLVAAERSEDVATALGAMTLTNTAYGQALTPQPVITAIQKVADYAGSAHVAVAAQANAAMAYTRRLEEELHTYWWVVGGWSDDLRKPFGGLHLAEAAIRAGTELAGKTTLTLGLFAAPALLDKVLRQDRKSRFAKLPLADAVKEIDGAWRNRFKPAASADGDLLPASLALYLSAESGDADDWQARFKRTTGIAANIAVGPLDLALQVHREILLARALPAAK